MRISHSSLRLFLFLWPLLGADVVLGQSPDRVGHLIRAGRFQDARAALNDVDRRSDAHDGYALWLEGSVTGRGIPAVREQRLRRRAGRLLRRDSTLAGAHLYLAERMLEEFERRERRLSIPAGVSGEAATAMLASGATDGRILFSDRYRGRDVESTVAASNVRLFFQTAQRFERAWDDPVLADQALRGMGRTALVAENYERLSDVAARHRARHPSSPAGWLYGGLAAYIDGRDAAAAALFEAGLERSSEAERNWLLNPTYVLPPSTTGNAAASGEEALSTVDREEAATMVPSAVAAFWDRQDPVLITADNERRTAHLARMQYADLRFGSAMAGIRGPDTGPGSVVVRYGVPVAEGHYVAGRNGDRFMIMHFGDFDFRYMDIARTGAWSFYSPPAAAYGGWRGNTELRSRDYVQIARERFALMPSRYASGWALRPLDAAVFRGRTGGWDVVFAGRAAPSENPKDPAGFLVWPDGSLATPGKVSVTTRPERDGTLSGSSPVRMWPVDEVRLRIEVPSSARGDIMMSTPLTRIPPGPGVSDLLLASRVEEGSEAAPVRRYGLEIAPLIGGRIIAGTPVYLYAESYDLVAAGDGVFRFDVEAVFAGGDDPWGDPGVAVRFSGQRREPDGPHFVSLDTSTLRPGPYTVGIRVTDTVSGRTFERRRTVRVDAP